MKLYHGSIELFDKVDLRYCKDKKDFGKGFYNTENPEIAKEQALANKQLSMANWNMDTKAYLYRFIVDINEAKRKLHVHTFNGTSVAWLDYIISNRTLQAKNNDYDIVIGKIADARTQREVEIFQKKYGGINATQENKKKFIERLMQKDLKTQYCFKTDAALEYLKEMTDREVY